MRLSEPERFAVVQVARHLPIDAQHLPGPRPRATMTNTSTVSEPQVLAVAQQQHAVQIRLHVQPELRWFVGHFTEQPLLPGVVQTNWAIEFGRRYLPLPPQFRYLSNMKFMRFILPDTQLELRLQYSPVKSELSFEYHDGVAVCASGRVGFGAESGA
jgi:3-hydroxymyristoyl/3-hydroxydecanoyl-(acyl carrier protein) dehydratase